MIPPHANYDGEVKGNEGMVALVVHDNFAIAYFCNGSTQQAWPRARTDGRLSMTGLNQASLTVNYALGHARGTVVADGIAHIFSITAVHKPDGLFQSIAVGAAPPSRPAGSSWRMASRRLAGAEREVRRPSAVAAPKLDISSLTAQYGDTTLVATPIDAETGSGF